MNKYYVSISIETENNMSRDDMIDYFTNIMFDTNIEMPFDPRGIMINSSTTSTEPDKGICVYGTMEDTNNEI